WVAAPNSLHVLLCDAILRLYARHAGALLCALAYGSLPPLAPSGEVDVGGRGGCFLLIWRPGRVSFRSYGAGADVCTGPRIFWRGASRSLCRGSGSRCPRSEEHTSELQSPDQLVCRLLLE